MVHVVLDVDGYLACLWGFFTNDLTEHRPLGWECLGYHLGLEAYNSFRNHRVEHSAGPVPRLGTLLHVQTQEF